MHACIWILYIVYVTLLIAQLGYVHFKALLTFILKILSNLIINHEIGSCVKKHMSLELCFRILTLN